MFSDAFSAPRWPGLLEVSFSRLVSNSINTSGNSSTSAFREICKKLSRIKSWPLAWIGLHSPEVNIRVACSTKLVRSYRETMSKWWNKPCEFVDRQISISSMFVCSFKSLHKWLQMWHVTSCNYNMQLRYKQRYKWYTIICNPCMGHVFFGQSLPRQIWALSRDPSIRWLNAHHGWQPVTWGNMRLFQAFTVGLRQKQKTVIWTMNYLISIYSVGKSHEWYESIFNGNRMKHLQVSCNLNADDSNTPLLKANQNSRVPQSFSGALSPAKMHHNHNKPQIITSPKVMYQFQSNLEKRSSSKNSPQSHIIDLSYVCRPRVPSVMQ